MASTAREVDRTFWVYPERGLFTEWGPRGHWIQR